MEVKIYICTSGVIIALSFCVQQVPGIKLKAAYKVNTDTGYDLNFDNVVETKFTVSNKDCAMRCQKENYCTSIRYYLETDKCILYSGTCTREINKANSKYYVQG